MDVDEFRRLKKVEMDFDGYRYRNKGGGVREKRGSMTMMKRNWLLWKYNLLMRSNMDYVILRSLDRERRRLVSGFVRKKVKWMYDEYEEEVVKEKGKVVGYKVSGSGMRMSELLEVM